MPFASASVAAARPAHYAEELVSNLAAEAEIRRRADGRAVVELPAGRCVVAPHGSHVELIALSPDSEGLATVQDVISSRLMSLGAQDGLHVAWSATATADDAFEPLDPAVADYVLAHATPTDEVLAELAVETRRAVGGRAGMQISHDEGALLTMLVRLVGAKNAVEVGTFTGYSSICIARGLAPGGSLLCCDVSEEWTSIARSYWRKAGVADRIDLKIAPAAQTLRALPKDAGSMIDFAFIDADKENYPVYYEEIVTRLRPGGVIALDNVLLGGRVVDPACQDTHIQAMRGLNERVASDDRVDAVMLPLRDGVTVIRKR